MMNYKTTTMIIEARIHPSAIVPNSSVVWDYARVLANVVIGEHCSIGGGTEIGRGSHIGNRTRIGANSFLPPDAMVGEDVFIGPNVTFTDDKHPRVPGEGDSPYKAEPPIVEDGASIGAGCVILPGIRIGAHARVGAGSVVTSHVAPGRCVVGSPARERPMPAQWFPTRVALPLTG